MLEVRDESEHCSFGRHGIAMRGQSDFEHRPSSTLDPPRFAVSVTVLSQLVLYEPEEILAVYFMVTGGAFLRVFKDIRALVIKLRMMQDSQSTPLRTVWSLLARFLVCLVCDVS